jgi:hypothetical protein
MSLDLDRLEHLARKVKGGSAWSQEAADAYRELAAMAPDVVLALIEEARLYRALSDAITEAGKLSAGTGSTALDFTVALHEEIAKVRATLLRKA